MRLAAVLALAVSATGAVSGCATVSKTLRSYGLTTAPGYAYDVTVVGAEGELASRFEDSSLLFARKSEPPPGLQGLKQRTRQDRDLFERILRSRGCYDGKVTWEIDSSKKPAHVVLNVTRGDRYTISRFEIDGLPDDAKDLASTAGLAGLGVVVGEAALAETVLGAETRLIAALAARGYPYAELPGRDSRIDRRARTLEVVVRVDAGPRTLFGDPVVEGLHNVDESFVLGRLTFKPGKVFSPTRVEESRRALFASGVFSGVSIGWGKRTDVAADGRAPIHIVLTEGDMHTVGAGAKYSSADGFGGTAFWENRNLSGKADRLRAEVEATQLLQTGGVSYRRPDWLSTGQSLLLDAKAESDKPEAYDRYALTGSAGVERAFTRHFVGTGGLSLEQEDVNSAADGGGTKRFTLIGVPLGLRYDGSDNPLDPTRGHRTLVSMTPFFSVLGDSAKILVMRATESFYVPLSKSRKEIWATRFSLGSVVGPARVDIPADKRMYAGGGDSVRGYKFQFVGPVVDADPLSPHPKGKPDFKPTGGRSLLQVGTELRWKVSENFGVVPFVEGAGIYGSSYPDFQNDFRWAAGLGLRYYTVAGPIRFDVGFPLNPQHALAADGLSHRVDDVFQVYISLGQAF